jgi:hypothetical protein
MSESRVHPIGAAPKTAVASLILGIAAVVVLAGAVVAGIKIEILGVASLLRGLVIPVSIAAVVVGVIARRRIAAEGLPGHRTATAGLVLGVIVLVISVLFIVIVAAFFSLMLFFQA